MRARKPGDRFNWAKDAADLPHHPAGGGSYHADVHPHGGGDDGGTAPADLDPDPCTKGNKEFIVKFLDGLTEEGFFGRKKEKTKCFRLVG